VLYSFFNSKLVKLKVHSMTILFFIKKKIFLFSQNDVYFLILKPGF